MTGILVGRSTSKTQGLQGATLGEKMCKRRRALDVSWLGFFLGDWLVLLVGFVGLFVFFSCSKNPDPNKLAILRTYTPLLYRVIHPFIGGSLLILGVVGVFGKNKYLQPRR